MTPRSEYQMEMRLAPDEIIVDSFAGGGGASLGIEWALGRGPHIAINHDKEAIALHAANHPDSEHFPEDVWHVDPVTACRGRKVGLMWLSPDCKHFSKAKGGKPVSKKIRGLAWTAVRWAKAVAPRVIVLENVEEFQTWGPVDRETNRPDPARKGLTFKKFVRRLERLSYQVEWRELRACDYGTPTIRKRLFLIARCDGRPIVWPQPTHGKGRPLPWRTAAECIDWTIECPSIFERKKALADNTMKRIARGIQRYVIDSPTPFLVDYRTAKRPGDDRIGSLAEPLRTQTTENRFGIVTPIIAGVGGRAGQSPERRLDQPYQTITAKGDAALVVPSLVHFKGDATGRSVSDPIPTQTSRDCFGLVAAHVTPLTHHDKNRGQSLDSPLATVTGAHRGEQALIGATLVQTGYGERDGQAPRSLDIEAPLGTVVGGGVKHALCAAFLAKHYGGVVGSELTEPVHTVTSTDHNALVEAELVPSFAVFRCDGCGYINRFVAEGWEHERCQACGEFCGGQVTYADPVVASHLVHLRGTGDSHLHGDSLEQPLRTVSAAGQHAAEVRAFLVAYYGNEKEGGALTDPLRTLSTRDRFALVTVDGVEYCIADIGMRMLAPRELYTAQGFPPSYRIDIEYNGKPLTKTAQVRMCGNSVCPPLAAAIISANLLGETFAAVDRERAA
jgi:DNA (cytosine-5)-methyltransferase 1